jgi:hypothetical protein
MTQRLRHEFYRDILQAIPAIEADARAEAEKLDLLRHKGRYGTYQGSSSTPGRLPDYVLDAIVAANRDEVVPARRYADAIRELVKHFYGDDYDVCVTNTAEAALRDL